ncbi:MAG: hypothetical protein M3468_07725 [Acidobacteriota bacterium]|nr:hypothetical protein [Acidobacteriota bacterium]
MQWLDYQAKSVGALAVPPGRYSDVSVAPDNAKAVLVRTDSATSSSLWLVDLTRVSAVPSRSGREEHVADMVPRQYEDHVRE